MKKIFNKGFTLIELLAVISLIALVLVITVPNFLKSNKKFAESSFESTIKAFQRYIDTQITNCISQTGSFNPNIFKENTCKLDDSNNFEKLLNASGYGDMLAGIKIDFNTNTIIEAEEKGNFADFKYLTNSNNFDFI